MRNFFHPYSRRSLSLSGALIAVSLLLNVAHAASTGTHYLVTNDDNSGNYVQNTVSFYKVGPDGELSYATSIDIGVTGGSGGYFPANRVVTLNSEQNQCVFASDADTGMIAGIDSALKVVRANGSSKDTGLSNGIGLALNSQYLYAGFTDDSSIGTVQIGPNCELTFEGDVVVGGLQAGDIDALAAHGNLLIATYGDGSIESFNISSGVPVSNGDKQNSTAYVASRGATYPSGIDITQDGHFVVFGDTSTSTSVEVADISSGRLAATKVYHSSLGVSSSNIMLSPDETLLYVVNTQGDRVSAVFFDRATGIFSGGCTSGRISGYSQNWSYLAGLALATNTGTGSEIYVAEFGSPKSAVAIIQIASAGGQCSLQEAPTSPVSDPNSHALLSIASFPPRQF